MIREAVEKNSFVVGYIENRAGRQFLCGKDFIEVSQVKGSIDNKGYFASSIKNRQGKVNRRLLIWSFLSLEWWLANYFPL